MNHDIKVDCYAGYREDEKPLRVHLGNHRLEVKKIKKQWITPDSRCFIILTDDNRSYRLEQALSTGHWKMLPAS